MKTIIKILVLLALIMTLPTAKAETTKSSNYTGKLYNFIVPDEFIETYYPTWRDLVTRLRTAQPGDVVHLIIQGYGGNVFMLNEVRAAIVWAKASKVSVVATVIGPALSAHATLVCFVDEVYFLPGSSLLFHYAAREETTWFGLVKYRRLAKDTYHTRLADSGFQDCIDKGLLTKGQLNYIKLGGRVTSWRDEVTGKLVSLEEAEEHSEAQADRVMLKYVLVFLVISLLPILRILQRLSPIK